MPKPRPLPWSPVLAVALAAVALAIGCDDAATETGSPPPAQSCVDLPLSQQASEPCCPEHGPDACGASLFCEAFDGRQQPTCYIEGSRQDREECRADAHCASQSCNLEVERCRSLPLSPCDPAIGCSGVIDAQTYACAGGTCTPTDGQLGSPCGVPTDCASGVCTAEVCATCSADTDCPGGACVDGACVGCNDDSQCASGRCEADNTCCISDRDGCDGVYQCMADDGCGNTIQCSCQVGDCDTGTGLCTAVGKPCTPGVTNCGAQQCLFDNLSDAYYCGDSAFGPSECEVDADCDVGTHEFNFNHCHFFGEYPTCRPWCLEDEECEQFGSQCVVDYPADAITPDTPGYCD